MSNKKKVKRALSIIFTIYGMGTIGGILFCLLELFRVVRFHHYDRLPLWEGRLILASNHPSWLDVVILPALYFPWWFWELWERTRYFLAQPLKLFVKKESIDGGAARSFQAIPVSTADKYNLRHFSWVLEGWNIFINRREEEVGERGGALKKAVEVLKEDGRIVIFPGGGRDFKTEIKEDGIYDIKTQELILRRPKPGLGWIVKQTGATIVPIRLEGTDKVLPNNDNEKLPRLLRFERYILRIWHPTTIKIGKPLRFHAGTKEELVLQKYIQAQTELYQEGKQNNQPPSLT
jgi:1-acyl-sn-glycerol-3-phosphate acyltransferase